jgi:hypothetical protein
MEELIKDKRKIVHMIVCNWIHGHEKAPAECEYKEKIDAIMSMILSLIKQREEKIRQNVGMLRQWLNEDKMKEVKDFVTNEQIEMWLGLSTTESKDGEGK